MIQVRLTIVTHFHEAFLYPRDEALGYVHSHSLVREIARHQIITGQ